MGPCCSWLSVLMTCRVALLVAFLDGSWVWIGKDAPNFRNAETKLDSQSFDRADRQLTCRLMVDGYLTRAAARSTLGQNAFVVEGKILFAREDHRRLFLLFLFASTFYTRVSRT